MDNNFIKRKCSNGDYTLRRKEKGKSAVWKQFREILDENGEVVADYVACEKCKRVYSFYGRKSGTSTLLKHKCTVGGGTVAATSSLATTGTVTITKKQNVNSVDNTTNPLITKKMKDVVTNVVVNYIVRDIKPFDAISGRGFLELAQCLVNFGAEHGKIDANLLLPHSTTVSSTTKAISDKTRARVKSEIKKIVETVGGAIVLVLQTDDRRLVNHLGVAIHYMSDFRLLSRVLCIVELDGDSQNTCEVIQSAIHQSLRRFELQAAISRLVFVTDKSSSVITSALKSGNWLNCAVNVLNTVLDHSIHFDSLVTGCRSLVFFFDRSGLQSRLKCRLPHCNVDTRWNGKLEVFTSIHGQWNEIVAILSEKNEINRIYDINKEVLHLLIEFLKPFKEAMDELEDMFVPTLYLVLVWYKRLLKHLQPSSTDCQILQFLKDSANRFLVQEMEIHNFHKIAVFLHPKLKSLRILESDNEKLKVLDVVREMISSWKEITVQQTQTDETGDPLDNKIMAALNENTEKYSPTKKMKSSEKLTNTLSDFEDSHSDDDDVDMDEISKYVACKVTRSEEFELLDWWKMHQRDYPHLTKIARYVHGIPASSTCAEKEFLIAELVAQDGQSSLNPDACDDILFLHSNLWK